MLIDQFIRLLGQTKTISNSNWPINILNLSIHLLTRCFKQSQGYTLNKRLSQPKGEKDSATKTIERQVETII